MVFTDPDYAVFLTLAFVAAIAARSVGLRNGVLLVASYVFYGWWDWRFLSLLVLSSAIDYTAALAMEGRLPVSPPWLTRRRALIASVAVNLGVLGVFKYLNFFIDTAQASLTALGAAVEPVYLQIILPIGISFYTFQSMSYSIDVYRGRQRAEANPIDFFLYVSFFPQLVAGPIERAHSLLAQFKRRRPLNSLEVRSGLELIAFGLFKKLLIADNLARIVDDVFASPGAGGMTLLLGVYAFAFQIYCDFSGYTDIARGSARLLGFRLRLNFHMPYFAADPRDFWRRWHISLSEWFRDYVYIPLGGRSEARARTALNVLLTMALCGFWHGAAWTFVLWGLFHGALLALSPRPVTGRNALDTRRRPPREFRIHWTGRRILGAFLTFHLVCFGWLIFRAESLTHLHSLIGNALSLPMLQGFDHNHLTVFVLVTLPLVAIELTSTLTGRRDFRGLSEPVRIGIAIVFFYLAVIGQPADLAPFIYFQF